MWQGPANKALGPAVAACVLSLGLQPSKLCDVRPMLVACMATRRARCCACRRWGGLTGGMCPPQAAGLGLSAGQVTDCAGRDARLAQRGWGRDAQSLQITPAFECATRTSAAPRRMMQALTVRVVDPAALGHHVEDLLVAHGRLATHGLHVSHGGEAPRARVVPAGASMEQNGRGKRGAWGMYA